MLFNLHTHSNYCDGSDHPGKYVKEAINNKFSLLGFSGHAPVPFKNKFAIPSDEKLMEYCSTIRHLQEKYADQIEIHLGLEIDYIPNITRSFDDFRNLAGLDYVIGSVHLVNDGKRDPLWFIDGSAKQIYDKGLRELFDGDIKKAIGSYYHQINRMVEEEKPELIGHIDKIKMHNKDRYFHQEEPWYKDLVLETLHVVKESDSIIEVNSRGIYKKRCDQYYPDGWILDKINEMNIPVTISTDAHKPSELMLYFDDIKKSLSDRGFKEVWILSGKEWVAKPLSKN